MKKEIITFASAKEMVSWLIDNEEVELCDLYGRKWIYQDYLFYYRDIGELYNYEKIACLHLFGTEFYYTK